MRYYIIAGERSGDLHGANLVKSIKRHDSDAVFKGFGGDYMKESGVDLTVHYSDMAFMGFVEVLKKLNTISKFVKLGRHDILTYKPDVVILIDYAGFNRQMASFCKKKNIKVFYYISPKVWAWHQRRALHLKRNVDRMFVILPFEKDFFKKYDWNVDYVGNPVLDAVKSHQPDDQFLQRHSLQLSKPIIALLPGSRKQELVNMAPILAEVVKNFPEFQFAVAAVNNLDFSCYEVLSTLQNVTLVHEDTYNLLLNANAAIVTSGTATLETALFKVPQTVVYKTSQLTYYIVKMLIKVPHISLVNLIAGKEVIRELIQQKANAQEIGKELKALLFDSDYRSGILNHYENIYKLLDSGSASENTARLMVKYLKGS
jgi:lipid-A-disaccharide synthase